jgi:hypothetical protein
VEDIANGESFRERTRVHAVNTGGMVERDSLEDLTIQLHDMPWAAVILASEQPIQKGA